MDEVKKALDEEIISQIKGLSEMTDGCEAKSSAIDDLTALYKIRLEEEKIANELEINQARLAAEHEDGKRRKDEVWKERLLTGLKVGGEAAKVVLPMAAYIYCFKVGLNFEQTGVFNSAMMKNHFRFLNPFR